MSYNIRTFKSTHSIFTNFETDHLNWHTDLQDYFNAKIRLFEHTTGASCINEQVFSRAKEFGLTLSKKIPNVRVFWKIPPTPLTKGGNERSEWGDYIKNIKDRTDGENIIISGRKKYFLSETQFS